MVRSAFGSTGAERKRILGHRKRIWIDSRRANAHLAAQTCALALRIQCFQKLRLRNAISFRSTKQVLPAISNVRKCEKTFGATHVMVSALGSLQTLQIEWFERHAGELHRQDLFRSTGVERELILAGTESIWIDRCRARAHSGTQKTHLDRQPSSERASGHI